MLKIVTYSPFYTLVPTYECFNRCAYCNFRTDPGQSPWLTLGSAQAQLQHLQGQAIEILVLSGEVHPASRRRPDWFGRIYDICELALSMGFLPHTNAGPLSWLEMARLKEVNVSMGLMLEQLHDHLPVHKQAPSKVPGVRLQQLEWAGKLQIPFTTGLLLGIGETQADIQETLQAIAQIHNRWGHIQEVILQPYSPGNRQSWEAPGFDLQQLPEVIATARRLLPPEITLQIPPNLVLGTPSLLRDCVEAGARDLGGIGPKDEVNPDYPHPYYRSLVEILAPGGWKLLPRLPVYPQYDAWLSTRLQKLVKKWRSDLAIRDENVIYSNR